MSTVGLTPDGQLACDPDAALLAAVRRVRLLREAAAALDPVVGPREAYYAELAARVRHEAEACADDAATVVALTGVGPGEAYYHFPDGTMGRGIALTDAELAAITGAEE
jgi:hypothetical protein